MEVMIIGERKNVGPSKKKLDELKARMTFLNIRKKDIEEMFVRSSGRGGQNVNKVNTACRLRHCPTGITARCGSERSQHLNRFLALRKLVDRIEAKMAGTPLEKGQTARAEKIRRRKKKRASRARKKYEEEKQKS